MSKSSTSSTSSNSSASSSSMLGSNSSLAASRDHDIDVDESDTEQTQNEADQLGSNDDNLDVQRPDENGLTDNSTLSLSSDSDMSAQSILNNQSSETVEYDVDAERNLELLNDSNEIIEIVDTQNIDESNVGHDNEDVIYVPQQIEVIDLCMTQFTPQQEEILRGASTGPSRNSRHDNRVRPYNPQPGRSHNSHRRINPTSTEVTVSPSSQGVSAITATLNQSKDKPASPTVNITCPICLESIVNNQPVATRCGHLFCKACIETALKKGKKCPMCNSSLTGRMPFHKIWL